MQCFFSLQRSTVVSFFLFFQIFVWHFFFFFSLRLAKCIYTLNAMHLNRRRRRKKVIFVQKLLFSLVLHRCVPFMVLGRCVCSWAARGQRDRGSRRRNENAWLRLVFGVRIYYSVYRTQGTGAANSHTHMHRWNRGPAVLVQVFYKKFALIFFLSWNAHKTWISAVAIQ